MDLADRISRGVVAALDLAPLDARFGELSRQVLQGGASRFAAVVDPTEPLDLVVPVGVPEASVNFGALVLQRSRVGLLWRDAHHGDRTALVALDSDTRATWTPVTLGDEEWTRFVVDDRDTRMVFLTPPTATAALRRAVARLLRAQEGPDERPIPEESREDLPDTAILPAITDASPSEDSPTVLAPVVEPVDAEAVALGQPVVEEPVVEEPDTVEQPAVEASAVEEPAVEQPAVEEIIVPEPASREPTATVAFTAVPAEEPVATDHSLADDIPQTGSDLPVSAAHPGNAAAAILPPEPAPAPWQPTPAPWQTTGAPAPLYRDEPRVPQQHPWSAGAPTLPPPMVPATAASSNASLTLVGFLAGLSITLLVGGLALVLLVLG